MGKKWDKGPAYKTWRPVLHPSSFIKASPLRFYNLSKKENHLEITCSNTSACGGHFRSEPTVRRSIRLWVDPKPRLYGNKNWHPRLSSDLLTLPRHKPTCTHTYEYACKEEHSEDRWSSTTGCEGEPWGGQRVWGREGNENDANIHTKMRTFPRGSWESGFAWSAFLEMEFLSQKDMCDFWSQ